SDLERALDKRARAAEQLNRLDDGVSEALRLQCEFDSLLQKWRGLNEALQFATVQKQQTVEKLAEQKAHLAQIIGRKHETFLQIACLTVEIGALERAVVELDVWLPQKTDELSAAAAALLTFVEQHNSQHLLPAALREAAPRHN